MLIDAHVHYGDEGDFLPRLVEEAARLGMDRICLNGCGPDYGARTNRDVAEAVEAHPELIIGFLYVRLGVDGPELVGQGHRAGFRGIKCIKPLAPYDDEAYFPIYEAAEELRMPILFHTGIVARTSRDREMRVRNASMRPVYLDTIARYFPGLTVIGAHLGNPWYGEAAMACRWNPNLYFDLSGSTLKCKSSAFLGEMLWWTETSRYRDPEGRHAWAKIVFGSDVSVKEIEEVMQDYRRVMDELQIRPNLREAVFGDTMADLLGLDAR